MFVVAQAPVARRNGPVPLARTLGRGHDLPLCGFQQATYRASCP